jgi:O-antigen/teichoic acid export membrane protein
VPFVSHSLRRAGWGIADQAFSSGTNFALGVLVARTVDLESFGAFSLAFAAYLLFLSVMRSYPMDPLAIRYAAAPGPLFRRAAAAATGTVVLVGVVAGAGFIVVGLATGGAFSQALIALGLTLPGLLLQDAWRSTFFASGRGQHAFFNDFVWAILEFPALGFIIITGGNSVFWPVLAWGGSATVAALVGIVQSSVIPQPWLTRAWWREHIDLGPRFIAETTGRVIAGQIQLYGVGFVAGLSTVGALRAGQLLYGPIQVVNYGIDMIGVPEGARALATSIRRLDRVATIISGSLLAVALGWGIVVLAAPADLGRLVLRDAWDPAHALAVPFFVYYCALGITYGPGLAIRSLAAASRSLRATALTSTLTVVFGIGGAAIAGATGSAWGVAVVACVSVAVWSYQALGARRDFLAGRPVRSMVSSVVGTVEPSSDLAGPAPIELPDPHTPGDLR